MTWDEACGIGHRLGSTTRSVHSARSQCLYVYRLQPVIITTDLTTLLWPIRQKLTPSRLFAPWACWLALHDLAQDDQFCLGCTAGNVYAGGGADESIAPKCQDGRSK